MTRALRFHGVVKRYGRRAAPVLADVDLEVRPGEVVRVTGANGSGKTTLLRLAAGVSRPSAGRVERGGRAGWAPDRLDAAPPLSARELLRALGVAPGEAAALAERLGFAAWLDGRLAHDSSGTLHKVLLAQALAGDPPLLVLDEPWAGLDEDARAALATVLAERRERGAALLLSEHGAGPLAADRTLTVGAGRIEAAAP
ncbi:MAG TPA: ATP-binding cassette domain-containing protein [Capillimicrobium sp.]|nr:ATP-binding cassette domain-containing protein [Capillimicrobium sp.]